VDTREESRPSSPKKIFEVMHKMPAGRYVDPMELDRQPCWRTDGHWALPSPNDPGHQ